MKLDFLAIGAHPDDVELGCGASIAKIISEGKKVGILDLTRGELGTRGTAETRAKEAKEGAEILGVSIRENLEFRDGFFTINEAHILEVVKKIRYFKPEIILCNAPEDRHPDHGKGSKLVLEACFYAGLKKIETNQEIWRPKNIFHYIQWKELKPDFIIDVSGFLDIKIDACLAYKTQFYDASSKEPSTPISSKNFKDSIRYRAQNMGRLINKEAGEGFICNQNLGLENFDTFI